MKAEAEVEVGEKIGRNEGHPKHHGRIFKTSSGIRPRSPDSTLVWDWTLRTLG